MGRLLQNGRALASHVAEHPLASTHRLRTMLRIVRWQVGSRLLGMPVLVPWVNDTNLAIETGMWGATGNYYTGLLEFNDMSFTLHALAEGDLFVDVGANVGAYTILAGSVCARVISVEPIPATFRKLRRNVSLNSMDDRVRLENIGVGSAAGQLRFLAGIDTNNRVARTTDDQSLEFVVVQMQTLDQLVGSEQPYLIKVDVEGFEGEVMAGADATLRKKTLNALIIEMSGHGDQYGSSDREIHEMLLDEYGFSAVTYDPFSRTLARSSGLTGAGNGLYVRNLEAVRQRVSTAPTFTVDGTEL